MVWWILVEYQKSAWRYAGFVSQQLKLAFFLFQLFSLICSIVLFFYRWPWLLPISRCFNMAMCLYSSSHFEKYIIRYFILCFLSILSLCGWEIGLLRAYESLKSHVRLTINFDQIEREPLVMPPWEHTMRIFGFFLLCRSLICLATIGCETNPWIFQLLMDFFHLK